jgi:YggT family protein
MAVILSLVQIVLIAVWALVLARLLLAWVDPGARNPVSASLVRATEPILSPVRRVLPQSGSLDWSGFLVLIVLGFLWRAF